ncbi:unnamed protein product [Rotaria sp. Silwood2]|nr:unnamed protein product [Rotaria sp. Silwood2]
MLLEILNFQNVSFTYPTRKDIQILNRINMKISSGKTVVLVGTSDCGTWFVFCIGVADAIYQFLSSVAFLKSGEALHMRIRTISFASMLRQEISWFDYEKNNVGAVVSQLSYDTSNFKDLSGLRIDVIFNTFGSIICSLTIAFITGWKLSLVFVLFIHLIIFSGMLQARNLSNTKRIVTESTRHLSWTVKSGIVGVQ